MGSYVYVTTVEEKLLANKYMHYVEKFCAEMHYVEKVSTEIM